MTSIIVRTALLINTTSRLTRDTPIPKPPASESDSQKTSRVASTTLSDLPRRDPPTSCRGGQELHYYRQQDRRNHELRDLSRAFRARL